MLRIKTLITLFASASVCSLVACKSLHGHEAAQAVESEAHEANEAREELEEDRPAIPLAAAIATAQAQVPEGRFLRAELESEDEKMIYSAVFAFGDGQREVNVDATSGAFLASEDEELEPESREILDALARQPGTVPVGVGRALEAALAKAPGTWAPYATLSLEHRKLSYAVCLIGGQLPQLAQVSIVDGEVQEIRELEGEDED